MTRSRWPGMLSHIKWSVERTTVAGFGLALVILVAIGVVSYQSTLSVEAAAAWRAHTDQVRLAAQALLSELQDAETGQRGFIITGDESYLAPYAAAVAAVGGDQASLRNLTRDNPAQQQRLNTLDPLIAAKLSELQQTIDLRRTQGFQAAQAVILTNQGQQSMDQIRQLLADLLAEEDRLYHVRDAALTRQLLTVRGVVVGGGVLAAAVALLALAVIRRELGSRRQAEAALARERDLLQALMDNIPDTIYFKDRASRFTRINRAQAKVLGVVQPADTTGKTDFDFQSEAVSRLSFDREQEIMANGEPLIDWIEYAPTREGAPRWFSSTKIPIRDEAGQVTGLVGISRDVTEHQQAQAALEAKVQERTLSLRMLSECNQALVRASDESSLLDAICHNIVAFGGYRLAWVGLAEPDEAKTVRPVAQCADQDGFLQTLHVSWGDAASQPSPSGTAIRTGQVVVTHDIQSEPVFAPWHAQARRHSYASAICLPLRLDGGVLGALSLYSASPEAFRAQEEVDLLTELSRDVAFGLMALRTRAALRRSDALLRDTSRMARVGGWELDLTTGALHWSAETYRIHDVDPSVQPDLAGAINFYAPEARPVIAAAVQAAATDGTPWDLELPFITATGKRLWVRAQGQAEIRDGRAIRLWGAFQDISESRQAAAKIQQSAARAEALARLSKQLAEVSTNYAEALEAIAQQLSELIGDGCALYLVSDDGRWLVPAAMQHREAGAAAALQVLKNVSPARADEGLSGRVLQTGQSLLIGEVDQAQLRASLPPEYSDYLDHYRICSLLCVVLRAEGRPLGTLVMSRSTPDQPYTTDDQDFLQEVAGRAALVISNARLYAGLEQRVHERTQALEAEITEHKQAEEEIRKLNQELARQVVLLDAANRELEAFSYSVSHDLRAPLRALDGFSQILLEDFSDQLNTQARNYLERVRAASQKMGELIDALLALARLTRAETRRERVDLSALARTLLAELQAGEPARRAEVVIAEGLSAEGDPRLLRAMLQNLLGNAWKFTSKTPCARIEFGRLSPEAAGAVVQDPGATAGETVFFVRDDGAGFDMAYAERLFAPFQRLHAQAEFTGSGIGLATVQRILGRHGGRVWAEGQVGQGATFYFTLPAR